MRRWGIGVVTVAVVFLWAGCAKDEGGTGPSSPPNYFPLKVGNWWVYRGVELDTAGLETGPEWRDSTVVVAQVTLQGRQGYVMVSHYSGGRSGSDTTVVASEPGRLYIYVGDGEDGDGIPFLRGWVKYADYSASSWNIWDTTLTNVPLDSNLTTSGTFSWRGERGGTMAVTVKGRTVTAQEFRVVGSFSGKLYNQRIEIGTLSYTRVERLWVAENIGVVRGQLDPSELVIRSPLIPGGEMRQKEEGERTVLMDYFVQ